LPLTGPLAPEAIKQQQGYDLWAEQANKAGGISVGGKKYKVEIVYADYQSNTPRAVQTTEQMITQNNVNFLFGPFDRAPRRPAVVFPKNTRCRRLPRPLHRRRSTIRVTNICSAPSRRTTH
jgi:ABC-type branched-subunit amino acid transport system substrate-binding protein